MAAPLRKEREKSIYSVFTRQLSAQLMEIKGKQRKVVIGFETEASEKELSVQSTSRERFLSAPPSAETLKEDSSIKIGNGEHFLLNKGMVKLIHSTLHKS